MEHLALAVVWRCGSRSRGPLGRWGRKVDRAGRTGIVARRPENRLSERGFTPFTPVLAVDDPTNEIGAACGIKELLRQLLACQPA